MPDPAISPPTRRLEAQLLHLTLLGLLCLVPDPVAAEFRMQMAPVAACAGTHSDSGGLSGNYGNSEFLVQTIWPARPGARVSLSFSSFTTENAYDFLNIHDGHSTAAPLLVVWTGTVPPQTVTSTAADGSLTLVFTSDVNETMAGWSATISCESAEQRMRTETISACDGSFADSGGLPANYQNLESFDLVVNPTHSGDRVEVSFAEFDTEAGPDVLAVRNGPLPSDPLLGAYSGTSLPPVLRSTHSSGALRFSFVSDGSIVGAGWRASISCANPVWNATLTTCSGTVTDTGGAGGNYGNSESFAQTIFPEDGGAKIELQFLAFSTELSWDILKVYDGSDPFTSPLLGEYSGPFSPGILTSSAPDGALTLVWTSDSSNVASGWVAGVSCQHPIANQTIASCSALVSDTGGLGADYHDNENLVQQFTKTRPWAQMRAGFQSFSSESGPDLLRVRDGGPAAPVLAVLTGNPSLPVTVVAGNPEGKVTLDWTSDSSITGPGWWGVVTCELPIFADGFEGRDLVQWSSTLP